MAEEINPRKEIEKREKSLEENLQKDGFYMSVLGVNALRNGRTQYGEYASQIGQSQYSEVINSDDANEIRKKLYEQEVQKGKTLGIADMPETPTNYQLVKYAISIVNESVQELSVSKLEEIVNDMGGAKIELPDELKEYEAQKREVQIRAIESGENPEGIKKAVEGIVDKDSEMALQKYTQVLYEAMKRNAAYKILDEHRYDDINSIGKSIGEEYKKAKGIEEKAEKMAA